MSCTKKFIPQGLSILYLLSESHFSIHTWPEFGACAIDFYHCGETARERMMKAEELLCEYFGWENCTGSMIIDRGNYCYALIAQDEHSSILYKKHKLVERQKSELTETRVYQNESIGNLLAVDGVIQMGFHNINNLGTFFDLEFEEMIVSNLNNPDNHETFVNISSNSNNKSNSKEALKYYFDTKEKTDNSTEGNEGLADESGKSTEEGQNAPIKGSEEKNTKFSSTGKRILIVGSGDLSLPYQIMQQGFANNITVLDGDINPKERLKALFENSKDLNMLIDNHKVLFTSDLLAVSSEKYDGVIVINKKLKPNDLKSLMNDGAFFSQIITKKSDFEEICKNESLRQMSFHEVSNTITRFLIGKARFS